MKESDKQLLLRVIAIATDALAAIAQEIASGAVDETVASVVPVDRRIAFYMAIAAAGPEGMSQSDLRKAALAAGYASLADTKVYYRKKGTPHLMKIAGYRTTLTDAGHTWLEKRTKGSAA
jgi:hypothetical protein